LNKIFSPQENIYLDASKKTYPEKIFYIGIVVTRTASRVHGVKYRYLYRVPHGGKSEYSSS
jgi:hypothetical protein